MSPELRITLIAVSVVLILLTGIAAYNAPRFFAYADVPVESDAIILFVGPDFTAREKEALRLLEKGYAQFLIIPAFQRVFTQESIPPQLFNPPDNERLGIFKAYPRFYENTHIEVLIAQDMMYAMELKSAIMISSPYHIRRIRMISQKVFGERSRVFKYVPSHYQVQPAGSLDINWTDWMLMIQESIKISWFCLYSSFISS